MTDSGKSRKRLIVPTLTVLISVVSLGIALYSTMIARDSQELAESVASEERQVRLEA